MSQQPDSETAKNVDTEIGREPGDDIEGDQGNAEGLNTDDDVEDERQPGRDLDARLFIIRPSPASYVEKL